MVANLASFVKYLGHSHIAIKSIVTGKKGAHEGHFQAININKAEYYIAPRNGKRQLWINLQKLKPEIGTYISFNDIESYKNVYIDLDCEKPDGMKDYAATESERAKALSQLPVLRAWLESHGLGCGLALHTGNGAGMVLPIPETKAEPVLKEPGAWDCGRHPRQGGRSSTVGFNQFNGAGPRRPEGMDRKVR
jgi:hypothetical protein